MKLIDAKQAYSGVSLVRRPMVYELARNLLLSIVLLIAILIGIAGGVVYFGVGALIRAMKLIPGIGVGRVRTSIKSSIPGR